MTTTEDLHPPDEATRQAANLRLREYAERVEIKLAAAAEALADRDRLLLENAMFRAGLDPANPAHQLVMTTYRGEPDPERIRQHWVSVRAAALHDEIVRPSSTAPADDGPSYAELEYQRAATALHRTGEDPDA